MGLRGLLQAEVCFCVCVCVCVCVLCTRYRQRYQEFVVEDVMEIRHKNNPTVAWRCEHTHMIMSFEHVLRYKVSPAIVIVVCPEIMACGLHGTICGEKQPAQFSHENWWKPNAFLPHYRVFRAEYTPAEIPSRHSVEWMTSWQWLLTYHI